MTSIGRLKGPTLNPRNYKACIVAKYLGLDLSTTSKQHVSIEKKTPKSLGIFLRGKTPFFESANKFQLTESSAIAYYIASNSDAKLSLLGKTTEETAEILEYIIFSEASLATAVINVMEPLFDSSQYISSVFKVAKKNMNRSLVKLNGILLNKTFLVGERLTIADIVVACDLLIPFVYYLTPSDRNSYRNVTRYFKTITGQPAFKSVVGDIKLCIVPIKPCVEKVVDIHRDNEIYCSSSDAESSFDAESNYEFEKQTSHEYILQKALIEHLYKWKAIYSNEDTRTVAIPWLWRELNPHDYSFWKVEYKYNDELKMLFMSNNLIGGAFNGMEGARKYAFGTLIVMGEDNDNMIMGYFIVVGEELPDAIKYSFYFDSFKWTRVDTSDKRVCEEIEAVLTGESSLLPREYYDGKVFN